MTFERNYTAISCGKNSYRMTSVYHTVFILFIRRTIYNSNKTFYSFENNFIIIDLKCHMSHIIYIDVL